MIGNIVVAGIHDPLGDTCKNHHKYNLFDDLKDLRVSESGQDLYVRGDVSDIGKNLTDFLNTTLSILDYKQKLTQS